MVQVSQCEIFKSTWHDSNRLFLKAKPEAQMRRSLVQYLRIALRNNADVLPEQNVDESHPVDVKVSFNFSNRITLIEIKWLGASRNPNDGPISTEHFASRALSGAKQLAEYLDWFHESAPQRTTRGVLVIFDARRRGLSGLPETISRENGFYYEHREIEFKPEFHTTRQDFEKPMRMFAEPRCE